MDRKSTGFEYDPETVGTPDGETPRSAERLAGGLLLLAAIVVLGVVGYKVFFQSPSSAPPEDTRALTQLDMRLTEIEKRLERLEENRKAAAAAPAPTLKKEKAEQPDSPIQPSTRSVPRITYRVTYQEPQVAKAPDEHLAAIQKGLGALQDAANENREAWKVTSSQLADVAGQVGAEHGEILRSQEELNQLLARTERTTFAFELRRGLDRQPVGPVSLSLKATNEKKHRYTACVYVQETCIELKDRSPFEVVQFMISGDTLPSEVIATKVGKDQVLGYLEVPREKAGRQDISVERK
jgi:hypothetical protein